MRVIISKFDSSPMTLCGDRLFDNVRTIHTLYYSKIRIFFKDDREPVDFDAHEWLITDCYELPNEN